MLNIDFSGSCWITESGFSWFTNWFRWVLYIRGRIKGLSFETEVRREQKSVMTKSSLEGKNYWGKGSFWIGHKSDIWGYWLGIMRVIFAASESHLLILY